MTDTGGAPGGQGDDTPTPSQGVPKIPAPGSGDAQPAEDHSASPATPPRGWQPPDAQAAPGPATPPGWERPPGWQPEAPPQFPGQQQYQQPYQQPRGWSPHGLGKPGVIALRPLNIGDILDGAITAIRRHPLLILGIGAVMAVVTAAITFFVQKFVLADLQDLASTAELGPGSTDEEVATAAFGALGDILLALVPTALLTTLFMAVANGLLAAVMGRAVLGREVTFAIAWREVQPRLLPLLGVGLLYAIATTVGGLLCFVPGIIAYVYWSLANPALVLERGTLRAAFSRSAKLVKGAFWRVFGILLLAGLLEWLVSTIIEIPFNVGSGLFDGLFNPSRVVVPGTGDLLLQAAGQIISGTITIPFVALVTVIVYLDQRMRREGMDIELARAAGVQPPQAW
jgi:hypothetical protein